MPRHKISLATRNYIYHILFECITRISLFFDIFLISGTRHICEKQKNTKRQSFQKKQIKITAFQCVTLFMRSTILYRYFLCKNSSSSSFRFFFIHFLCVFDGMWHTSKTIEWIIIIKVCLPVAVAQPKNK